jgi:hypothetical protein
MCSREIAITADTCTPFSPDFNAPLPKLLTTSSRDNDLAPPQIWHTHGQRRRDRPGR